MSLYSSSKVPPRVGLTEFEILKASHRFLRDGIPEDGGNNTSWNEQLVEKYYQNLYREFAVCDLKHYKSGNFALRWRTEDEVLSGAGETTCANTRCEHHHVSTYNMSSSERPRSKIPLTTLELPFAYEEHGEHKSALVKVVLCDRCVQKLMYKRNKEKKQAIKAERARERANGDDGKDEERHASCSGGDRETQGTAQIEEGRRKRHHDEDCRRDDQRHHKRHKRSHSPHHTA